MKRSLRDSASSSFAAIGIWNPTTNSAFFTSPDWTWILCFNLLCWDLLEFYPRTATSPKHDPMASNEKEITLRYCDSRSVIIPI